MILIDVAKTKIILNLIVIKVGNTCTAATHDHFDKHKTGLTKYTNHSNGPNKGAF